jgi:hypothetical protein
VGQALSTTGNGENRLPTGFTLVIPSVSGILLGIQAWFTAHHHPKNGW